MKSEQRIGASEGLKHVRYEIRGRLARRAHELERQGYEIVSLNIGNPRAFGLRTPETMRLAMIENLGDSEGYCHQKGIFPAREAVVMQQQERGITGVRLRALLNEGDEVLVPSPDYPLWTAAVTLNRGRAVHYPCRPQNGFVPDPEELERLTTPRTRAIVIINPNNPTGAVYPRAVLEAVGAVEGVPRLRLPRRLGGLLRPHARGGRLPERARAARIAAPVQQRDGAMGGADRARRTSERARAGLSRRTAARVAPGDSRRCGAQ